VNLNKKPRLFILTSGLVAFFTITSTAYAHGFGERYDLPMPLLYFIIGAIVAVGLSFLLVGIFVTNEASLRSLRFEIPLPNWLKGHIGTRYISWIIKCFSVLLLVLILITTLIGSNKPIYNFSPTFIWIIWWVGLGFVSAVLGNVWPFINPWKITFEFASTISKVFTNKEMFKPILNYPVDLKGWPAVILFAVFAWIENVYWGAAIPRHLAVLVIVYSLIQWGGMLLFGKQIWLKIGDPFNQIFRFFSKLSIFEINYLERKVFMRPPGFGFLSSSKLDVSTMIFVLILLSTVTFDGIKETPFWANLHSTLPALSYTQIDTLGLIIVPAIFISIYLIFCFSIRYFSRENSNLIFIGISFAFSLLPIALAYHFAHYLSLLLIPGQAIIPLLSDPFGIGWNLFGSADYQIKLTAINAKAAWFFSVFVIVIGHVLAVYVSHVMALKLFKSHSNAIRSQYPMLLLMLIYTAISLWILSMPIIE
tara:strand:- start:8711 stop:10144 length:1434 start_codon:yes stop_codon:yes gene_type:complete